MGLLRETSRVLLDHQAPTELRDRLRAALEDPGDARVVDLHVWSIGPGLFAAAIALVGPEPRATATYKRRIPPELPLVHVTLEVHRDADPPA